MPLVVVSAAPPERGLGWTLLGLALPLLLLGGRYATRRGSRPARRQRAASVFGGRSAACRAVRGGRWRRRQPGDAAARARGLGGWRRSLARGGVLLCSAGGQQQCDDRHGDHLRRGMHGNLLAFGVVDPGLPRRAGRNVATAPYRALASAVPKGRKPYPFKNKPPAADHSGPGRQAQEGRGCRRKTTAFSFRKVKARESKALGCWRSATGPWAFRLLDRGASAIF